MTSPVGSHLALGEFFSKVEKFHLEAKKAKFSCNIYIYILQLFLSLVIKIGKNHLQFVINFLQSVLKMSDFKLSMFI